MADGGEYLPGSPTRRATRTSEEDFWFMTDDLRERYFLAEKKQFQDFLDGKINLQMKASTIERKRQKFFSGIPYDNQRVFSFFPATKGKTKKVVDAAFLKF